jgi:plastocyanin
VKATLRRGRFRLLLPFLAVIAGLCPSSAAQAVHLFPLVPGDPAGDCAPKLSPAQGHSAGEVGVGYFSFDDHPSGFLGAEGYGPIVSLAFPATTTIKAGESVTWRWEVPYCHSIQTESVPAGAKPFSTAGGAGSATGLAKGEDTLVRPTGANDSFTVRLTVPGTYEYYCVHHRSAGMVGEVIVTG